MMTDEETKTAYDHQIVHNIDALNLFPMPRPTSREEVIMTPNRYIDGLAHKIIADFPEITEDSVIDVKSLSNRLGGKVVIDQFFSFNEDIQISKEDSSFTITLPNAATLTRNRFTVAHELGHYLLHYILPVLGGEEPFSYRFFRKDPDRFEQQADRFAASLTMPEEVFTREFEKKKSKSRENGFEMIEKISNRFKVSPAAVQVRIKSLDLG